MSEENKKHDSKNYEDNKEKEIRSTKESFRMLCKILNKPRPYRSSDFVKQHFIPDLSLAAPLAVGAAMKVAPMVQYFLMNSHQM